MFVYVEKKVHVSHPSCSEFMIIVSMSEWDMHAKTEEEQIEGKERDSERESFESRCVYKLINLPMNLDRISNTGLNLVSYGIVSHFYFLILFIYFFIKYSL